MRTHRRRARRGFSLGELMISMTLIALIGVSLTKLIVTQSRFSNKQVQQRNARSVSRGALAIMESELRAVEQSTAFANGNVATSFSTVTVPRPSDITFTVNVPWAVGVKCTANRIALLPVDSISADIGIPNTVGVAWRGADERYVYDPTPKATTSGNPLDFSACAGIVTATGPDAMPNMRMVSIDGTGVLGGVPGTPVMLFYRVQYAFRPSTTVPGRIGLFRAVATSAATFGTPEELIAPFGMTAGFRYFVGTNRSPTSVVPANLETITGIQLDLHAQSETRTQGQAAYETANYETSIFFRNRI